MPEIGQQHAAICHFIAQYTQQQGWPPSRREIGAALGFTSTSHVAYYLAALEQQGYLHRQPHISRGLALTSAGQALAEHASVARQGKPHPQNRLDGQQRGQGHTRSNHNLQEQYASLPLQRYR